MTRPDSKSIDRTKSAVTSFVGAAALLILLGAVTAEVALRTADWVGIWSPPSVAKSSYYVDDDPLIGIWRRADAEHRHVSDCFDVTYRTNSIGARDSERAPGANGPRAIVLGDSFVEGFGVEAKDRLTERLESVSGFEHMNFGIAGNFAHVQAALLYERMAQVYEHSHVMFFALPDNDWIEADPERFWQPWRYRPYIRDDGSVYYPTTIEEAATAAEWRRRLEALGQHIHLFGFGLQIEGIARARRARHGLAYNEFEPTDLTRMLRAIERIKATAGDREVWVITIPRLQELRYAQAGGDLRLPGILGSALAKRGVHYLDLTAAFLESPPLDLMFLPCDGHWSPQGHLVAGDAVGQAVWGLQEWGARVDGDARAGGCPEAGNEPVNGSSNPW